MGGPATLMVSLIAQRKNNDEGMVTRRALICEVHRGTDADRPGLACPAKPGKAWTTADPERTVEVWAKGGL